MKYFYEFNNKQYSVEPVPNQKIIQICKVDGKNGMNISANEAAQQDLSWMGWAMYCYFLRHQHNWIWQLWADHAMKITKLGKSSYHKAIKELETKGYLQPTCIKFTNGYISANAYKFLERPAKQLSEVIIKSTPKEDPQFVKFGAVNRTKNVSNEYIF